MEKKKIVILRIFRNTKLIVKDNLSQITFLLVIFLCLYQLRGLPYVNIVQNYIFYVFIAVLILAWIIYYRFVKTIWILYGALASFILAIPAVIFHLESASSMLGFISFILLAVGLIQRIYSERRLLGVKDKS